MSVKRLPIKTVSDFIVGHDEVSFTCGQCKQAVLHKCGAEARYDALLEDAAGLVEALIEVRDELIAYGNDSDQPTIAVADITLANLSSALRCEQRWRSHREYVDDVGK